MLFPSPPSKEEPRRIKFVSVTVHDLESALRFYTEAPGFRKMADIPMGEYSWLTVTPADGLEGAELGLEQ